MKRSDEDRFTDFVRAYSASLFRTAYLMTGDYQRAEDILQTSLVRIYQRWTRIDAMDHPSGYAHKVVVSQAASWWRRRSSRETSLQPGDEPAWDGRVEDIAEHERVWQAVLSLPRRQRAVTVLRYYEDLTEAQIAETLDMAPGTVKSHSHAAGRRLAELLGEPRTEPALPVQEATS
ncbi:MAG TPA: SigE family RNA polymerase sigma factor [Mycobacteriales bacterium]|nr:SigE family RNA polymerase sigma factor [Mycobacteriales bacterium]